MTITGAQIVAEVGKFVGYKYVYGGSTPAGFDCSGLVQYVLTQLGVSNVPRTSEAQWGWVTKISKNQLQPGDLVFAQFPGDNASPGHVGVYVGGGNILSAEDPASGVGYSTLSSWGSNIVGYGAVPGSTPGSSVTGNTTVTNQGTASGSGGGATGSTTNAASDPLGVSGLLAPVTGLVKDLAVALDYFLGMFGRGQGWRLVFTALMVVTGVGAWKCLASVGVVPEMSIPKVMPA